MAVTADSGYQRLSLIRLTAAVPAAGKYICKQKNHTQNDPHCFIHYLFSFIQ